MKKYYTLAQAHYPSKEGALDYYLLSQGIKYRLGAEWDESLASRGHRVDWGSGPQLVYVYYVLIEEYELSAIKLSVDGVQIIKNRRYLNFINGIRMCIKWVIG